MPTTLNNETNLVASCLLEPDKTGEAIDGGITADSFNSPQLRTIYETLLKLFQRNGGFDLSLVANELKEKEKLKDVGGRTAITTICEAVPTGTFVREYIEKVKRAEKIRNAKTFGAQLANAKNASEIEKIFNSLMKKSGDRELKEKSFEEYLTKILIEESEGKTRGSDTGILKLDQMTVGLRAGHFWVIGGLYGTGKCHAKGTKILMHSGHMKNIEEIETGDKVMGVDSSAKKVKAIGRGKGELFKITPRFAEPFIVNGEHILSLACEWTTKNKKKSRTIRNISVNNYLKQSVCFKRYHPLYSIGVNFNQKKKLEVEPYFLGVWLGDGSSDSSRITTADFEIVDYLKSYAGRTGLFYSEIRPKDKCRGCSVVAKKGAGKKSIQFKLRFLNLLKNKHIPQKYKTSSRENRLELLAGLLDSDGSRVGSGFEFSNNNERLVNDVLFLSRSLGFRARKIQRIAECKKWNYRCNSYRVSITGECWKIPTKIKRKQVLKILRKTKHDTQSFKIEHYGTGDYFGFELGGDHLYFIENFTIHHNTTLALEILRKVAAKNKVFLYSLEMAGEEILKKIKWMYFQDSKSKSVAIDRTAELKNNVGIFVKKQSLVQIESHLLAQKEKPKVIFIDYIQLIETGDKTEYERTTNIARSLKNLAQKLEICVVGISQVSHESVNKNLKTIGFRGGGEIAAAVDVGIILVRDFEAEKGREEVKLEVAIRKNRHGRSGGFDLEFNTKTGTIIFDQ